MMQRSFKNEIKDEKTKKKMVDEFIDFYSQNINNASKPIRGIFEFFRLGEKQKIFQWLFALINKKDFAVDLLKKLDLFKFFEYVAGSDTFAFNKPDPRHLTDVVEIIGGDLKKIMIGDSEVDCCVSL